MIVKIKEVGKCRQCGRSFKAKGSICDGYEVWVVGCGKGCITLVGNEYNQTVGHLKILLQNGLNQ